MSKTHKNHEYTERIISLVGSPKSTQLIALNGEKFKVKQMLNRKGGRPLETFALEFCLTLPKKFRPTPAQWHAIIKECCLTLAKKLSLSPEEQTSFLQQVRAVLHQQDQKIERGSGDHVHLILSKIANGRVLQDLQRKQTTKLIKQAFTAAAIKNGGFDPALYTPKETGKNIRLPSWHYQQQKAKETLDTIKLMRKLQRQADKWFEALEMKDIKQQNRQENRLLKTFQELSDVSLSIESQRKVELLLQRIESKRSRTVPPL